MLRIPLSATMAAASIGAMLASGALLSGCVVVAVGGAGVAGYAVVAEDLPAKQQMRDYGIKAEVQAAWGQFNQELAHRLDATVFDGQVLITGRVPDRHWREEAVRRAHEVGGVRRVFDQASIGPDTHFIDSARDTFVTTELRGQLIADIDIKSINYVIKTNDRVIYVMGVARTPVELERVINHARNIAGVRRVTPFVRVMTAEQRVTPPEARPEPSSNEPPLDDTGPPPEDDEDVGPPPASSPGAKPYSPPPAHGTVKEEKLP